MDSVRRRILRTLLGVAYGDAMGMPTEGCAPETIRERFGTVRAFMPSPAGGSTIARSLRAAEVTDDTEHTVFVCESLLAGHGRIDAEDYARRLIEWADHSEKSRYVIGPSTARALDAIRGGAPIARAGSAGTTNGAAMRVAPIGLVCSYHHPASLVRQVAQLSMPTHNTRIAIQGASAVAMAVSYCFENPLIDWDELYRLIADAAREAARHGAATPGPDLMARVRYGWDLAERAADDGAFLERLYSFMGTGMETAETVPAALSIVRRGRASLRACVLSAANVGGDTDTIGAICGGICAAGRYDIPDADEAALRAANDIDFDGLAGRMARLVDEVRGCS